MTALVHVQTPDEAALPVSGGKWATRAAFLRDLTASGGFAASRLLHDLLSELPDGAHNHLSLPRRSTPDGRLKQVARNIAPQAAAVFATRQLKSRMGGDCYFHTFGEHGGSEISGFIEKRSKNGREYRFNREKSDTPCPASSELLPKLFATHKDRAAFTIYTEYVPLPVEAFLEEHSAEHLAEYVFRITEVAPVRGVYKAEPKNRFTPNTLEALMRCVEANGAIEDARVRASAERIAALWDKVAASVPAGPLVLAHGDLHLDNLRTAKKPDGGRSLKMLDWEKVGMNYVGADLDFVARGHLSRAAIPKSAFLVHYVARARDVFGVSASSVQLAAHLTAAGNCIKRVLETGRFDNLHLAAKLMVRAQHYLAIAAAWVVVASDAAGL